jgi:hypothetical protein
MRGLAGLVGDDVDVLTRHNRFLFLNRLLALIGPALFAARRFFAAFPRPRQAPPVVCRPEIFAGNPRDHRDVYPNKTQFVGQDGVSGRTRITRRIAQQSRVCFLAPMCIIGGAAMTAASARGNLIIHEFSPAEKHEAFGGELDGIMRRCRRPRPTTMPLRWRLRRPGLIAPRRNGMRRSSVSPKPIAQASD